MSSTIRQLALSKSTRRHRVLRVDAWDTDIAVVELDGEQRTKFLSSVATDGSTIDLTGLIPYITDLIREPGDVSKCVFEPADNDVLMREHPNVVSRVLLAALDLSELGETDIADAEGN